jgi:hypothetical protein
VTLFGTATEKKNRIEEVTNIYLLSLQHVALPKVVTSSEDGLHVSALKATGLIEADIAPALDAAGKYNVARTAVVTRITEEGMAEINMMLDEPRRLGGTFYARSRMRSSSAS